jgi:short-subunit dehydrogenase
MPTAVVTGATAGIGAAFARRLAAESYDLVLVARDSERLAVMAKELRDAHGGQTEVLSADLSTAEGCSAVADRLADADRPVDLLVNNAGIGLPHSFLRNSIEDEERMLAINVTAILRLTHAALPGMLARRSGSILNVSSVAGFGPVSPGHTYGATKAWVNNFSESIYASARHRGVHVMALCPGFVRTEFHSRARIDMTKIKSWQWLDADELVVTALRDLRRGRPVSTPSAQYKFLGGLVRHAPRPLFRFLVGGFARRAGRNPE